MLSLRSGYRGSRACSCYSLNIDDIPPSPSVLCRRQAQTGGVFFFFQIFEIHFRERTVYIRTFNRVLP